MARRAISEDGSKLWVASHRSGQPSRYPFPDDPRADERDLDIIDVQAGAVRVNGRNIRGVLRYR